MGPNNLGYPLSAFIVRKSQETEVGPGCKQNFEEGEESQWAGLQCMSSTCTSSHWEAQSTNKHQFLLETLNLIAECLQCSCLITKKGVWFY